MDDEGGGFETHRGGSFGIVEQVAEGLEGTVGEGQGFFAELDGADVVGVEQSALKRESLSWMSLCAGPSAP